ncbi:hypothetical protein Trydic_g18786 [Trypoxylus dichotomus]
MLECSRKVEENLENKITEFERRINLIPEEFAGLKPTHTSGDSSEELPTGVTTAVSAGIKVRRRSVMRSVQSSVSDRARASGWLMTERTTAVVVLLRGAAVTVLQSLSESAQQYYDMLVMTHLGTGILRNGDGLQKFETGIERLVRLAFPSAAAELWEQRATQAFIDGIKNGSTQEMFRRSDTCFGT